MNLRLVYVHSFGTITSVLFSLSVTVITLEEVILEMQQGLSINKSVYTRKQKNELFHNLLKTKINLIKTTLHRKVEPCQTVLYHENNF